jgi:hypothetical protein
LFSKSFTTGKTSFLTNSSADQLLIVRQIRRRKHILGEPATPAKKLPPFAAVFDATLVAIFFASTQFSDSKGK